MKLLGAVLAGGRSSRFGSDKALAPLGGKPLIAHVVDALRPQVAQLLICGRQWDDHAWVEDRPGPNLGPLGGINAALQYAARHGFDAVLTAPCDVPKLPSDLAARLAPVPAFVADLPVVGCWPASAAAELDVHIGGTDRSIRGWARRLDARPVAISPPLINVNHPEELQRAEYRNSP